jgi:hypothetical protein
VLAVPAGLTSKLARFSPGGITSEGVVICIAFKTASGCPAIDASAVTTGGGVTFSSGVTTIFSGSALRVIGCISGRASNGTFSLRSGVAIGSACAFNTGFVVVGSGTSFNAIFIFGLGGVTSFGFGFDFATRMMFGT